ncbi:uncharacterized protein DNG_04362 [Cephalotrichum gorgonifer]|uniref:Uncharacterized protein n=1 Tax=Cephalotrichum gorgonifer TaxID=2041049 RepID=A0AAE8MXY4_9PEZI|nr:uncharacterized protein DNG_04362 [Cephalotrichum gorgonifer]
MLGNSSRGGGKVLAVTSAHEGIGYAVVEATAETGADVEMPVDVALKKATTLAKAHGVKATPYKVDRMAIFKPILDQTLPEYKKHMSVNVDSGVLWEARPHRFLAGYGVECTELWWGEQIGPQCSVYPAPGILLGSWSSDDCRLDKTVLPP